ncbi:MAG: class I SAM-dependent methyltransferase [Deltaproteobacteria bacterium]|jgi:hypothetical protein|nr:class I SAM-dependent methyltransferase [Deltaproteobacteria bacterium]
MAKLPTKLSFMRPLIFLLRKIFWKILGASDTVATMRQIGPFPPPTPVDNRMMRLWERLNILESHINWRLHGLPPRIVNVKLEQAGLLAGSGEVEGALEIFKQHSLKTPQFPVHLCKKISKSRAIFIFPGDNNQEWKMILPLLPADAKVTLIDDTSDLFRYQEDNELVESERVNVLRSSAIDASARLVQQEFDLIWISSILQRLTPIQAMIILKRCQKALLPGGVCAGIITDQTKNPSWPDPRWLHPFSHKQLETLIQYSELNSVKFQSWGDFELFHFQQK